MIFKEWRATSNPLSVLSQNITLNFVKIETEKAISSIYNILYPELPQSFLSKTTTHTIQFLSQSNLIVNMTKALLKTNFEIRKKLTKIITFVLRQSIPTAKELASNENYVMFLIKHANSRKIGDLCLDILTVLHYHDDSVQIFLKTSYFEKSFLEILIKTIIENQSHFSVAFCFLKILERISQPSVQEFFTESAMKNYGEIEPLVVVLTTDSTYFVKKISLKWLISVLLSKKCYCLLTQFTTVHFNMVQYMKSLKQSPNIEVQVLTLYIFILFAVNPQKPECIYKTLTRNKKKLKEFVTKVHSNVCHKGRAPYIRDFFNNFDEFINRRAV